VSRNYCSRDANAERARAETKLGALTSLADRLTDPQDRASYAALISYLDSLPPGDDLLRLAELLGLLSLLGQRLPDALAEFLAELRAQTRATADYHAQVDGRLARLPEEIAAGVDPDAIAKSMSESFRQQLVAVGLQDTAVLLRSAARDITALANHISASLKPVAQQFKDAAATLSNDLQKLDAGSRHLEDHNAKLMRNGRTSVWVWQGLLAVALLLFGGLCGIVLEEWKTVALVHEISSHIPSVRADSDAAKHTEANKETRWKRLNSLHPCRKSRCKKVRSL
jgi:hypothetical protein